MPPPPTPKRPASRAPTGGGSKAAKERVIEEMNFTMSLVGCPPDIGQLTVFNSTAWQHSFDKTPMMGKIVLALSKAGYPASPDQIKAIRQGLEADP